jgi:large conductance mechanosensitive channel
MKKFGKEFKDFIATGNMIELAVAVILGGAVGAVIKSFTDGIMMQFVAAIFGKPDFKDVTITLRKNVGETVAADGTVTTVDSVLQIGLFINALISLLLTGLVLFMMVKAYNRMKKAKEVDDAPAGPTEVELLTEIRDALKARD